MSVYCGATEKRPGLAKLASSLLSFNKLLIDYLKDNNHAPVILLIVKNISRLLILKSKYEKSLRNISIIADITFIMYVPINWNTFDS